MSEIVNETSLAAAIQQFGRPALFVGAAEAESPWVPFLPNIFIRHLGFDVRNNTFINILWIRQPGLLGRHRHRGPVWGYVLEGSWRYLEHDWVASPGSYLYENPGTIHTLVVDDPQGMKTLFWLNGALEFFDEKGEVGDTLDVFWFIDHYVSHCRKHDLKINEQLWI